MAKNPIGLDTKKPRNYLIVRGFFVNKAVRDQ